MRGKHTQVSLKVLCVILGTRQRQRHLPDCSVFGLSFPTGQFLVGFCCETCMLSARSRIVLGLGLCPSVFGLLASDPDCLLVICQDRVRDMDKKGPRNQMRHPHPFCVTSECCRWCPPYLPAGVTDICGILGCNQVGASDLTPTKKGSVSVE